MEEQVAADRREEKKKKKKPPPDNMLHYQGHMTMEQQARGEDQLQDELL